MAINPNTNNTNPEIERILTALANLPATASSQERQSLLDKLQALQSRRNSPNNNQPMQQQNQPENSSAGNSILDNALAKLSSLLGLFSGSADPHSRVLGSQNGLTGATEGTQEAISAPLETEPKRSGTVLKGSALKAMFTSQLSDNKERLVADMKRQDIQARHANPAS